MVLRITLDNKIFSNLFINYPMKASVRCQVVNKATVRGRNVWTQSLCAELQKGVLQQDLVMTKTVLFKKSVAAVSSPHSSAFTQPIVLMSRASTEETRERGVWSVHDL